MRGWLGRVLTPDGQVPLLNDGSLSPELLARCWPPAPPPVSPLHVLPRHGPGPGRGGRLARARRRRPALPAGCRATRTRTPSAASCTWTANRCSSTPARPPTRRAGPRLRAVHRRAQHRGGGRRGLHRGMGGVPSRPPRAGQRAGRPRRRVRITCEAAHDGYRHLPGRPGHRRRWTLTADGLRVDDEMPGKVGIEIVVRWHLAPGPAVRLPAAARSSAPRRASSA